MSAKTTDFTLLLYFRICRGLLVLVFVWPLLLWHTDTWEKSFQGRRFNFRAWCQRPCSSLGRTSVSEPEWGETLWRKYPYGAAFLPSWWSAGMGGAGRKEGEKRRKRWRKRRGWGGGGSTQGWDTQQSRASNYLNSYSSLKCLPPPEMVLAARNTWQWGERVNVFTLGSWVLVPALALLLLTAFSRKHHVSPLSSQALGSDELIYSWLHVDCMGPTLICVCSVAVLTPAPFRSCDMETAILSSSSALTKSRCMCRSWAIMKIMHEALSLNV